MPEHEEELTEETTSVRPFWSGTISFGLVSVPVDVYPGNRSPRISLRMLDEDGTPLARRYFCPKEERELDPDEIVRGYEIEDGKYMVVTDEELESLEPRKSRDIDLRLFVDASSIDPLHFERAYFLAPSGESTKAYRLLAQIMEQTGRAGIATFVMREREYLVAILAENGILRAETMRFADEVRTPEDLELSAAAKTDTAEVRKIEREIDKLVKRKLELKELHDTYAQRLLQLVDRKRKASEDVVTAVSAEREEEESVIDLMELLKQRMRTSVDREPSRRASRRSAREKTARRDSAAGLASQSRQELYERAKQLGIEGRSSMSRSELIEAIRKTA